MGDTVIIRQRRTCNFTILDNAQVRDARLSWKARGLLAYLLSLSEGWQLRITYLIRQAPDGRHSTRAGLAELQRHGYLVIARERGAHGRFERTTWTIVQTPPAVGAGRSGQPLSATTATARTATQADKPPQSENQTVVAPHQDPENRIVEKWTGTTEVPSTSNTTTTSRHARDADLVMPPALASAAVVVVRELVSGLDADRAQQVLDEVAGAMARQGTIKTSPVAYLRGLVERVHRGEFRPSLGIAVASTRDRLAAEEQSRLERRATRRQEHQAANSDAARQVAREHLARMCAMLGSKT